MALLAAVYFATQKTTWSHIRTILFLLYLFLTSLVYFGIDEYNGDYTVSTILGIVALLTGIFFFLRK